MFRLSLIHILKNLETQIRQKQPELDGKIVKLQAKIERNLEYRKRAYEQFMDEVISKDEYLELKQMLSLIHI